MAKGALQARNTIDIVRGGYKNEEHHPVGEYYDTWTDVGLVVDDYDVLTASGVTAPGYLYRDSDVARNDRSTAVIVNVEDEWTAKRNLSDNSVEITVTTYLKGIQRTNKKGSPPPARRTLAAYKSYNGDTTTYRGVDKVWGDYQDDSAQTEHAIKTGRTLVGTRTYTLMPGQKTGDVTDKMTVYFWNHVTGHAYDEEIWLDCMYMGLEFRNNLPANYPPPDFVSVAQRPDICTFSVVADMTFTSNLPPNSGKHTWLLEVSLEPDYSDAMVFKTTTDEQTIYFNDMVLKPTQKYYWRIQLDANDAYSLTRNNVGWFKSLEVIPPNEVVPEFDEYECENLTTSFPLGESEWPKWKGGA